MFLGLWIALVGVAALIVAGLLVGWKLFRRADRNPEESNPPPIQETGAKPGPGGGAGLRSIPAVSAHAGLLAERAGTTRMLARRAWRTRLGFALFALAVMVLIGAGIVGLVLIQAFEHTLPTVPEDSAREAQLEWPADVR
jgi:hypothetical protein